MELATAERPASSLPWARWLSSHVRLRRDNTALWVPSLILLIMVGACFLGPIIMNMPTGTGLFTPNLPIGSSGHLLGTDTLGNDVLAQCLYGGRISFEVGFGAIAIGGILGSAIGLLAAYYGGVVDPLIMRCLDVLLAFPGLILALALAAALGPSEHNEIIAISFFTIPVYARLARAQTLQIRERDFVVASRLIGGRRNYIAARHVYPNIVPTLLTFAPLGIGIAMLVEATLSFLGVGVRPPTPSWGNIIAQGQEHINTQPRFVIVPVLFLLATVFSLNLVGEQLRVRYSR